MTSASSGTGQHSPYGLSDQRRADLAHTLRRRCSPHLNELDPTDDLLSIVVDGRDSLADLGRDLEYRVFSAEAGEHTPEIMHATFDVHDRASLFILAVRPTSGELIGASRLIIGTAGVGSTVLTIDDCLGHETYVPPTIDLRETSDLRIPVTAGALGRSATHVAPAPTIDLTADVTTRIGLEAHHGMVLGELILDVASLVGLRKERAALRVSELLIATITRIAQRLSAPHAVALARQDLYRHLERGLRVPVTKLGDLDAIEYYAGDPFLSQPMYVQMTRYIDSLQALQKGHRTGGRSERRMAELVHGDTGRLFLI